MRHLTGILAALLLLAAAVGAAQAAGRDTTLRTRDNSPLCGFYYFFHWWEPWRTDDALVLKDLKQIKAMGCNTLFIDSEWIQAMSLEWFWLDRGHRLAREAGLEILPWLSLKEWADLGSPDRMERIKETYGAELKLGLDSEGKPDRIIPYDAGTIEAGYRYCDEYLERYLNDGALLRVWDEGKLKPVIAITVELEWQGSDDEVSCQLFRKHLLAKYTDIAGINKAWGTRFGSADEIRLMDMKLFDFEAYLAGKARHTRAIKDQIDFRARVQNDAMAEIKRRLKNKYPDLLIATELPYEMYSQHPHGRGYEAYGAATPETTRHAEINVLRCTGYLSKKTEDALIKWQKDTGQHLVITYRTYRAMADFMIREKKTDYYGIGAQAARIGDGFGFYSWNEMVDTHIAAEPDIDHPYGGEFMNKDQSDAWRALASQQIREYRSIVK
ncbi:MAG: hypothetical protein IK083_03315 [Abditibacteriota bacterium]|nr:hypothetical protein [Abditibacteriota bacterium]